MGIPKLFTDLQRYNERIALASKDHPDGHQSVHVVIDGPSLVYFVYSRLAAFKATNRSILDRIPTYSEINTAYLELLEDLEHHGVWIQRIYFDGALPVAKRDIRLDRLERSRRDLCNFHERYRDGLVCGRSPSKRMDFELALWGTRPVSSQPVSTPIPVFMVAAVIDTLRQSPWRDLTEIVKGEADEYCATEAHHSNCSVLTSDSDLPLFDLGEDSCVIWLNSLEKTRAVPQSGHSQIVAECIRPAKIAKWLDLSSLLRLGFERCLDSSANLSEIKRRSRDVVRHQRYQAKFDDFSKAYEFADPSQNFPNDFIISDPRLLELAAQLMDSVQGEDSSHIYFPVLLEHPGRDASWSYGIEYRAEAYGLLLLLCVLDEQYRPTKVREHYRKGPLIKTAEVELRDPGSGLRQLLIELEGCKSSLPDEIPPYLLWWSFALRDVGRERVGRNKHLLSAGHVWEVLGFQHDDRTVSWDTIHIRANAEAILYSLRLLKGAIDTVVAHNLMVTDDIRNVSAQLADLPSIAELHLTYAEMVGMVGLHSTVHFRMTVDTIMTSLGGSAATERNHDEREKEDTVILSTDTSGGRKYSVKKDKRRESTSTKPVKGSRFNVLDMESL